MLIFLFSAAQVFLALKYLHHYQMNGYRFGLDKRLALQFACSDLLCLLFLLDVFVPAAHLELVVSLSICLMVISVLTLGKKTPVRFTKRLIRNYIAAAALIFACNYAAFFHAEHWLLLSGLFTGPLTWLASLAVLPLENRFRKNFVERARERMKSLSCRVIGITGSFGKTTTKNMLYDLLKDSFRVVRTPASYNTEMGVAMTVLNEVKEDTEILICEMGARKRGDIAALCEITGADDSILTSIGYCHYKTFGSLDAIKATKFELCEHTRGCCVFADTPETRELYERATCEKLLGTFESVGINSFNLEIGGETHFFRTNLVGTVHQKNLVLALLLAHRLGVDVETLKERCLHLERTPHRLQIIKNGAVTILDDSYNSNLSGVRGMIEVVKSFSGRKILVTCGMVELGKLQYRQNVEFARLCGVFDFLFIISRTNRRAFEDGLAEIGYPKDRVVYFRKLSQLQEFLKGFMRGSDLIVFENDLPDNYL